MTERSEIAIITGSASSVEDSKFFRKGSEERSQDAANAGVRFLSSDKRAWSWFIVCGVVFALAVILIIGGTLTTMRQSYDTAMKTDAEGEGELPTASAVHLESHFDSTPTNETFDGSEALYTPFVCTVGLSLDFFNHAGLLREDGLCDYFIFHSTFVRDAQGHVDLWNGRNYTRAFRTFLAFAKVARKTSYGVAVTHRKSRDALRQLGTQAGVQEFTAYWSYGIHHHGILDLDENRSSGLGNVRPSFALLKAFKYLQHAQEENDGIDTATLLLGCSIMLHEDSSLHHILIDELRVLHVDVLIITTHLMTSEAMNRTVVPPTALTSSHGGPPPAILDVAHYVWDSDYLSHPTAICFTLTMAVLAYDVPAKTRVGAAYDKPPARVPIKEMCRYSNYPQDIKYGNGTVISRFYSTPKGRLYLFDTKDSFRYKMCTLRQAFPYFDHGWAVFDVDLADYDGSCNGATRSFDRVHAIRETFDEYLTLGHSRPPTQSC